MPPAEFPDTSTVEGQHRARAVLAGVAMRISAAAAESGDAKLERKALRTASRAAGVHPLALKAAMGSPAIVAKRNHGSN